MKRFLGFYLMTLIIFSLFFFFGGWMLFDFSGHFACALASCSFVIALVIYGFLRRSERIDELEEKIKKLEEQGK